jgi:hypothetical protein
LFEGIAMDWFTILRNGWVFLPAIALLVIGSWLTLASGSMGPRPWPLLKRIAINTPRAVGMTAVWAVALLALQHLIGLDLSIDLLTR